MTLLMVTLCVGLYSCSKEVDIQSVEIPSDDFNSIYKEYGLDPAQYKYLKGKLSVVGETILAGLKNGHIWMAVYETNSKKKLYEVIDTEATKEEIIKNLGYGKSETLPLNNIQIAGLVQTERGAIGQLNIVYMKDVSGQNYQVHQTTFFNSGSSIKKKTGIINDNYKPTAVSKWYKDAVILSDDYTSYIGTGSYCCNDKGDTLYVTQTYINSSVEIISYEEGINIGWTSERWNYKTGKLVWSSKVNDPFEIPDNTKRATSILDKSTDTWKCKVDLLYYDGTKKDFTFEIDINDGMIIGQDIKVTGITMIESSKELNINDSFQLSAVVKPENATNKNLKWSSSNESVATVDITGLVTAHSSGEAIITATTDDGNFEATATIKVLSPKHIVQVKSDNGDSPYNVLLTYANGKLSNYIWKYNDGDYEFNQRIDYSGKKIIMSGIVDGKDCVQTYTLNGEGYATSCSIPDYEGKAIDISFEYSEEGYLVKAIEIIKLPTETRSNTYSFTYSKDGDITQGKESDTSGHIYTQTYVSRINKSGIMDYAMSQLLFNYQTAFYCGLLGKPCKHLPSSCKQTEVYEMGWSKTYEFIHEQDNNGYVTKTVISDSDGDSEVLTYTYDR